MTTEKEQLEAEIAKRDARIAELEAQAGDGTSGNKYRAELYDEVWQAARDMDYGNVTAALQELAALKAQQPSAGVVDERSAFESWVKGEWPEAPLHYVRDALPKNDPRYGEYVSDFILRSWIGWQARARLDQPTASAGVVLPEPLKRGDEGGSGEYGAAMIRGFNACLREVARLNPCRAQSVPDGWADAVEACAKLCEERAAYYESGDDDAPGSRRGNACRHCADVIRYNLAAAPSASADSRLVPVELLERLIKYYEDGMSIYGECEELRALLARSESEVRS